MFEEHMWIIRILLHQFPLQSIGENKAKVICLDQAISSRLKTTSSFPVNFSWTLLAINSRWLELAT